jgi:hypothetical protein
MEQVLQEKKWTNCFDRLDGDAQLKQTLEALELENGRLRQLVVRLSETIIRNVTGKP